MLQITLWKSQPGDYFCLSTKSKSGKWKDHFFERHQLAAARKFILANRDKNVYACPHGFSEPRRIKQNSIDPCLLYADLDEADPRQLPAKPTIAIESSPGRYVGYWLTDKPCSEELNRRFAYFVGADPSGWDRTQVLRVPKTKNYKYDPPADVKVLWDDGPTYEVRRLEKMAPELDDEPDRVDHEAGDIYKRYQKEISGSLRKQLMKKNTPRGADRSRVLWRIAHELAEAGLDSDEIFTLLYNSVWNKHASNRDGGERRLREDINKAIGQHFTSPSSKKKSKPKKQNIMDRHDEDEEEFKPLSKSMAEVEEENIEFLIPGMLARKEVTILEGDPGVGKSYLMQMIAGVICDGKPLPLIGHYDQKPGRVAYFDTENTAGSVTKIRLVENKVTNLGNYFQEEEPFSVDGDRWDVVFDKLREFKPDLVVFDTINMYIGGADTYRSSEVQQALYPFKHIATEYNCAVVLLRHLTKGGKEKALYRGQGSIAFAGVARIVLIVGHHPEEHGVRICASSKNNIGPFMQPFSYWIEGLPDTETRKNRSRLIWGDAVPYQADQILGSEAEATDDDSDALKWLEELFESEPKFEYSKILKMAQARSLPAKSLDRAASKLGIRIKRRGAGKKERVWWYRSK